MPRHIGNSGNIIPAQVKWESSLPIITHSLIKIPKKNATNNQINSY